MARPTTTLLGRIERAGQQNAESLENIRRELDLEGWAAFPSSFIDIVNAVVDSKRAIVVLSGDVHFSYSIDAKLRKAGAPASTTVSLVQLVSSALQNQLSPSSATSLTKLDGDTIELQVGNSTISIALESELTQLRAAMGNQKFSRQKVDRLSQEIQKSLLLVNNIGLLEFRKDRRRLSNIWLVARSSKAGLAEAASLESSLRP